MTDPQRRTSPGTHLCPASEFPAYTRREVMADGVVHLVGVPAALGCVAWMLSALLTDGTARQLVAASLYGAGLVGTLAASAAYNLTRPGRAKAALRRLDHAMIFVMIAGSYTPFALCALGPDEGMPLAVAAWSVALLGAGLKLWLGNRYDLAFIVLYLAHGWMILPVLRSVIAALAPGALALLVAGGVVYSAGVLVHTRQRWPFHNAIWHVMVLVAAGLHLGAISQVLGIRGAA